MITTPDLIDSLVTGVKPVRRLAPPLARVSAWLLFAGLILGLLAVSHGMRSDLATRIEQPSYLLGIGASLLTGVLAAVAAFFLSLPDRSRLWLLLPVPTLLVWVSTIGYGCLTNWVSLQPDSMRMGEAARCFATLVLTSAPLSLALLVMLRHAAAFASIQVSVMASLAVAAMTASALSLYHDLDATVMILMWNLGVAALIAGAGSLFGRRLLSWVAPMPISPAR